jgi:hypothetical protein
LVCRDAINASDRHRPLATHGKELSPLRTVCLCWIFPMKLSVVIPCYNEVKTTRQIVEQVRASQRERPSSRRARRLRNEAVPRGEVRSYLVPAEMKLPTSAFLHRDDGAISRPGIRFGHDLC